MVGRRAGPPLLHVVVDELVDRVEDGPLEELGLRAEVPEEQRLRDSRLDSDVAYLDCRILDLELDQLISWFDARRPCGRSEGNLWLLRPSRA